MKRLGRHLDGTEVPHLLLARPMKCGYISWGPFQDMTSSAEMNSACGKVLLRKTLVTRTGGGEGKKINRCPA